MSDPANQQYIRDHAQGMADALYRRMNPRAPETPMGQEWRAMSIIEMAREHLTMHHIDTRGKSRMEVANLAITTRAIGMHGTSDFTSVLAAVANKRLRDAYNENPGTYSLWARRAPDAPDFKEIKVVQLSSAPDLMQTNEHGEFKYGKMTDSGETYSVLTYGRIVSLTRQAMVNDDLRGFDRMLQAFGASARRLENRLVYAQLTGNAALADGVALFHANHANLATGAPSALQLSSMATARTAMRLQKGMAGEELNLAPAYLIVPAALETTAYQLTSSNYVPAKPADINEFRAGGATSLEPVIEPLLDSVSSTAWFMAAKTSQVDTVEYCYLDGADGPVIDTEIGFEQDGVSMRCRLDFAAKAIDHRGLYRAAGA
jgi:hypothetical protein